MAFPTTLDDLNAGIGASGDPLSSPNHITQHTNEVAVIEALEAKVGIDGSAVTTTHDYKLSGVTSTDKAASLAGIEDLTNKSLKTGTKITLGSDATGDIYYRHSDGTLKRLAADEGKILKIASGVPTYATETTVVDASVTAKGIVEEATLAEIDAGTGAGGTSARLFVNPSTLGKSIDGTLASNSDAKIPSEKAVKTYVDNSVISTSGVSVGPNTSSTQTITHSLGKIPKIIRLNGFGSSSAGSTNHSSSVGTFNSTGNRCLYVVYTGMATETSTSFAIYLASKDGFNATGIVQNVGATTFDIVWTVSSGNLLDTDLMWEAQ